MGLDCPDQAFARLQRGLLPLFQFTLDSRSHAEEEYLALRVLSADRNRRRSLMAVRVIVPTLSYLPTIKADWVLTSQGFPDIFQKTLTF